MGRSPERDSLAFLLAELKAEPDSPLRRHRIARCRRRMREYLEPRLRDLAVVVERAYALSIVAGASGRERRAALATLLSAERELGMVARRARGATVPPVVPRRKRQREIFSVPKESRPRRRAPEVAVDDRGLGPLGPSDGLGLELE